MREKAATRGGSAPASDGLPFEVDLNRDLVILEMSGAVDNEQARQLLLLAFWAAMDERAPGEEWFGFVGTGMVHWRGLSTWIGITDNAPIELALAMQQQLEKDGVAVERELGRATTGLVPTVRSSDDGFELLVPAKHFGDFPKRRPLSAGVIKGFIRGYVVGKARRSQRGRP